MVYYDTNWMRAEPPEVVAQALADNKKQDDRVEALFRALPNKRIPAYVVRKWCFPEGSAESNTNRAMNTLTRRRIIVKMPKPFMVMGPHGKKVHVWRLYRAGDEVGADGYLIVEGYNEH